MNITITLVQDEIIDAIKDYIAKHDVVMAGKNIDIDLVAGRGPAGHSAVINIKGNITAGDPVIAVRQPNTVANVEEEESVVEETEVEEPKKRGRKPGTKAKITEEVDALFAQENELTEDPVEEEETEESLFGSL